MLTPILNELPQSIYDTLLTWKEGPHRARRLNRYLFEDQIEDFANMPELRRDLRKRLAETYSLPTLELAEHQVSCDGTEKFSFRLQDGATIETVLIPNVGKKEGQRALCVSTQAGCAVGCLFCHTGLSGLKRNLKAWEILEQIRSIRRRIDRPLTHIVFMGMGEPLHNYKNLFSSIHWLTANPGLRFSKMRITVSTSGLLPEIQNLLTETEVRLAISLNATTEKTRLEIMPVTKKYSLQELLDYCRKLSLPRADRITFEYVLLAGVNDTSDDAKRLVSLLHGIRSKINLLAFNEFPGSPYRRPSDDVVEQFRSSVQRKGLQVNVRRSRGRSVLAACGQLRSQMQSVI